jgi:hypothetical protein
MDEYRRRDEVWPTRRGSDSLVKTCLRAWGLSCAGRMSSRKSAGVRGRKLGRNCRDLHLHPRSFSWHLIVLDGGCGKLRERFVKGILYYVKF